MFVKMFTVGMLGTNCFLVGNTKSHEAAVIDPGFETRSEAEAIFREIERNEFTIKYIINTHGHVDHTCGNGFLKEATKAPILIHESDASMLSNPKADQRLSESDLIEIGNVQLKVVHTPGHSRGSVILVGSDSVFSGDTLFAGSIGRYDLPGGSLEAIKSSLKNKLLILPDPLRVYPGHGPVTTVGEERRSNPFLQSFDWEFF